MPTLSKPPKQAEAAKNQASEETLRLQRSVTQLQAAHEVAQLEFEIAEKNVSATQTRMDSGTANLHDLDDARSQVSERFITLQDVTFDLETGPTGIAAINRGSGEMGTGYAVKVDTPTSFYSFPRNIFTTCRIAFSFRRYHRHCPCLLASTKPAFVRIDM